MHFLQRIDANVQLLRQDGCDDLEIFVRALLADGGDYDRAVLLPVRLQRRDEVFA